MNNLEFDALVKERTDLIHSLLLSKGKEYASNGDRLHNFELAKETSPWLYKTREDAMWAMGSKHLVSVMDILNQNRQTLGVPTFTESFIREKFGDLINYLVMEELSLIYRIREAGNVII